MYYCYSAIATCLIANSHVFQLGHPNSDCMAVCNQTTDLLPPIDDLSSVAIKDHHPPAPSFAHSFVQTTHFSCIVHLRCPASVLLFPAHTQKPPKQQTKESGHIGLFVPQQLMTFYSGCLLIVRRPSLPIDPLHKSWASGRTWQRWPTVLAIDFGLVRHFYKDQTQPRPECQV